MSHEQDIRDMVDEAKTPGTFSIIKVLQERGYPEAQISVHIDEAAAYEASVVKEKLAELDEAIGKRKPTESESKEQESLVQKQEELMGKLESSRFVFHVRGISEGKRESLINESNKKYPIEFETMPDLSTGKIDRVEKQSPERDNLFTDFLWQNSIVKIVDPEGNEHSSPSYSDIREMRSSLPLSAMSKVNEGIDKLRVSTTLFMYETGEDFLAKP